ncbi:MAG: DNA mismatch endonuclease Vsr [Akkermansiaceae bacterium]|nr:DNA mismatch endonuclease Vsr [Akkermansiaceae bacterium]
MDIVSKEKRSRMMSGIKGKNTKPELLLRSALHKLGFRFRIQRKDLPGKPDIVLPKYKTIIFVHGCFWHRHPGCKYAYTPKSNIEFWTSKLEGNVIRDRLTEKALEEMGWRILIVWECEVKTLIENDSFLRSMITKEKMA